ncbi:MAG: hypothetical protein JG718_12400 [Candidatus Thiothrix moscowensis]|nr:hypothetical protein [Candidatus Thiothrix moscowensis]
MKIRFHVLMPLCLAAGILPTTLTATTVTPPPTADTTSATPSDTPKPDISLGDGIQSGKEPTTGISFSEAVKALEAPEKGEFAKALEASEQAGQGANSPPVPFCTPTFHLAIGGGGTSNSCAEPDPKSQTEKEEILKKIGEMKPADMMSSLIDLELRLRQLEANRNTIQAPFKVVDKQGRVILSVTTDNQGADYFVMGEQGKPSILLQRNGEYARVAARVSADNRAYLNADTALGASAAAEHNHFASGVGTSAMGGSGLFIRQIQGQAALPAAEIAALPGKKVALRLYNEQGKAVVSAGMNPAAGGAGTIRAANTKGENIAFMGTTPEGENGAVGVAKNGKDVIAMLAEPRLVAVYNDTGAPIVSMGKSDKSDGGNLTTRDPAGDGVFSAGYNSEVGGGDACVYRAKRQNTFCLGIGLPGMMGTMGN